MPIHWHPRTPLAAEAVRRIEAQNTDEHDHQWESYLHTAYVMVRTPLEHHCRVCTVCHQLLCEAPHDNH